jgi:hypothetical protein
MLIIRGNPRVADIYVGEFMRVYRHFGFRDWLAQHPEADDPEVGHLDETDQWWKLLWRQFQIAAAQLFCEATQGNYPGK